VDEPPLSFSAPTRAWFSGAFQAPTPAQSEAWAAIAAGRHTLVVAPTGSGKTLAAFLAALDGLICAPPPADPLRRCRVVYVSPLKALAVDVDRNLRSPLAGIRQAAHRLGAPVADVRVGMRTGDTPAGERRAFGRRPPDVLITTPESLFLLLTSAAADALQAVQTVIVDEVHALVGGKRGAHLAVTLERLDVQLARPAQRIGLSATVRPVEEVARFLGGGREVSVVNPPATKTVDLRVEVPVEDLAALGATPVTGGAPGRASVGAPGAEPLEPSELAEASEPAATASIWPAVERRVYDLVRGHRSTIVFANSRRVAERLTARLNELAHEALTGERPDPGRRLPAQLMGQSGAAGGVPAEVARAHHGSVSREQRRATEEALKAGRLPAVVATSSLELGIDMGAVDLVVQVEAPPSVASGLQRIGRAGHQVGAVSKGVVLPKYRGDLLSCAVVAERMAAGRIEALRYPRNPLDVLAQQVVAMVARRPWGVEELAAVVRRAAPYAGLPDSALHTVLDMLAGRYPSDEFAQLRPRIIWDRVTDVLTARPGALRLAVTSGGTIPDRGLFGVFLVGERASRVGELDEEMVYESRVGDVFLLGSSSWRIEDITHDRVLVTPAPGQPGRMPFWKGDSPGRPLELGRAQGSFIREFAGQDRAAALDRARRAGLDDWAATNLVDYLAEQRTTGALPDDRTVVVERFHDELGDWRVVVHSVFGAKVNAPWALAIAARLRERYGVDVAAVAADDGIVVRIPETESEPPDGELAVFDPDEIEQLVTAEVGGSALFAARFRECASRALLMPRRRPGLRSPLWQQRQRAAQLLSVASRYGDFPVVLEAMRECLQDVYDVPGLVQLMRDLAGRRIRVVETAGPQPSPFARSLLFGYVGAFLYEGDAPLAERRAQALTLDTALLAELLGQAELRELLEPAALGSVERELQRLAPDRRVADLEGTADLLRLVGDLSTAEAVARGATPQWLAELARSRRALQVRIAGETRWLAVEDAGRVRDALGVALPVGVPEAFTTPVVDPLGDLVARYARTHGPFTAADCAARLGIGPAVAAAALHRLAATGRVVSGHFRPDGVGPEWCDAGVLRQLRRRSLAALRREVEPVPAVALARFLPAWQQIPATAGGEAAVLRAVEALQGALLPASAIDRLLMPARVAGYSPAQLDGLCAAGDVVWAGAGALPGGDGWVSLALSDAAQLLLPPAMDAPSDPLAAAVLAALDGGQALFFRTLSDRLGGPADRDLIEVLWGLVWAGLVTNDTLAPLRALIAGRPAAHRTGRPRRPAMPARSGPPTAAGRWSRLPDREPDPTRRLAAMTDALLDRYGVLTRGTVAAEDVPGGFAAVYRVLTAYEDAGRVRRGYFVEGLGAAQFAVPGAVDRLRSAGRGRDGARAARPALVLAAADPANPYGAALPWPERQRVEQPERQRRSEAGRDGAHRPGRKAGALVVLADGELVLYVERGGRSLLSYSADPELLAAAAAALSAAVRSGGLGRLAVQRADGEPVGQSPLATALLAAGFRATPRGLRLSG